jgi:hypothetical protein
MGRRNLCPNPAAKNNTTGYSGSATFARTTDFPTPACPRSTGVRATGSGYIQTPAAACAPGDVFSVSFYGDNQSGSFDFGHTVYVSYTRSSGGDTFPESFVFGIGASGSQARATRVAAAAPALATGIYLLYDSLSTGYGMTGVLLEKVGAVDTYADGDTVGWAWDGTNGNSTSSEATLPAEGSAAFTLDLAVDVAGARASAGATDVGLHLAPAGAGARASAGTAAVGLALAADAHGARASAGVAGIGLDLALSASSGSLSPARGPWIVSRNGGDPRIVTRAQITT